MNEKHPISALNPYRDLAVERPKATPSLAETLLELHELQRKTDALKAAKAQFAKEVADTITLPITSGIAIQLDRITRMLEQMQADDVELKALERDVLNRINKELNK